ncbi:MAG TPA: SUF system NifU family Fe-S cluster assembly protein [Thermoanaerobaculia bacterium]|nr:SUF system NifU family Fe-S cluster assembly protein [Thermoanaerobaculia bacterium]
MSSDLRDLYQEVILDHNRRPRNFGTLASANRTAEGHNPLCGDRVRLFVDVEEDRVRDIAFEGSGCAISTASASLMTEAVKGKTVEEARELFRLFHDLMTAEGADADDPSLGKLAVFAGVREYPIRIKCATLAWHAFQAALANRVQPVVTE